MQSRHSLYLVSCIRVGEIEDLDVALGGSNHHKRVLDIKGIASLR